MLSLRARRMDGIGVSVPEVPVAGAFIHGGGPASVGGRMACSGLEPAAGTNDSVGPYPAGDTGRVDSSNAAFGCPGLANADVVDGSCRRGAGSGSLMSVGGR